MDVQTQTFPNPVTGTRDPREVAQQLGHLLRQTAEFEVFLNTLKAVNNDAEVQKLGLEMQAHQNSLRWGRDDSGQHALELSRLQQQMESLSVVLQYRQAEMEVQQLIVAVDEIISHEAGMAFAINARRGGCCG